MGDPTEPRCTRSKISGGTSQTVWREISGQNPTPSKLGRLSTSTERVRVLEGLRYESLFENFPSLPQKDRIVPGHGADMNNCETFCLRSFGKLRRFAGGRMIIFLGFGAPLFGKAAIVH